MKPPWRNGLACWTSNSKVVGSSPTGGGVFLSTNFPLSLIETCKMLISLKRMNSGTKT